MEDISFPQSSSKVIFSMGSELLTIKLPGKTDPWWQKNNYPIMFDTSIPALTKVNKETKTWSGIWIEDSSTDKPGIFQDIEVFIKDMSYSQVFCKSDTKPACRAGTHTLYGLKHTSGGAVAPNFWYETGNKFTTSHVINGSNFEKFVNNQGPVNPMLEFVGSSRGEWVDANSFCKSGSESGTEISDEELNNLELYCSKPKK